MSTGGQDLFVVCKNCGSEVSPYITECPYCGSRLRKRAPKLDRDQRPEQPQPKVRRVPRVRAPRANRPSRPARSPRAARSARTARPEGSPLLSRLRPGEIPGLRVDRRPYATIALVVAGLVGCLLWRTGIGGVTSGLIVIGRPGSQWWRPFSAAFVYDNTGYAFICLGAIALYGWLLERRHGPLVPLGLFLIGGVGGIAATAAIDPAPIVLGANGAALALLCAWSVPDLIELSRDGDVDADLIGTAVIGVAVALMPLAVPFSSWIADAVGMGVGFLLGLALSRAVPR